MFVSRQIGLSLIELLIALLIGVVLMLGISQVFLSTRNVYSNQDAVARMQETGRLAMEFIARDTRMAGYVGCSSGLAAIDPDADISQVIDNKVTPYDESTRIDIGLEGVDGSTSTVPTAYGLTSPARAANTDILVIRAALGGGIALASPNTATSLSVSATATDVEAAACSNGSNRVKGICADDIVVVADCAKSTVFKVASISDAGVITPNANFAPNLYGTDAELILGTNTTIYYIATSPTTNRRGLWQKSGNSSAVELVEGVEDMQILYGRDTNNDEIPDVYQTAAQITAANAWSKVQSVRVQLLVQSIEDNIIPAGDTPPSITFNGAVLPATDHRLRQVFSSTIGVRTRLKVID